LSERQEVAPQLHPGYLKGVLAYPDELIVRYVIRRDQLSGIASYAGTLLHEMGHMVSDASDGTLEFELVLSELLGRVAATVLWRP
jgi:hypothetical protein